MQWQTIYTFPGLVLVGGALTFNIFIEGLHVEKVSKPHPLHPVYCTMGTNELTYFVTSTTTNGAALVAAGQIS